MASTGIRGLDDVLAGGLPRNRVYLLQGDPGVGKTTLGLQFLLEGRAAGEPGLYVSLSETREEITAVAKSHGWSLDGIEIYELSAHEQSLQLETDNTVFHPAEVELRETMKTLLEVVERLKPRRVVFDSLSEIRLLSQSAVQYRRQILQLKQYFIGRSSTVLLLDDRTGPEGDTQLQSLAHGVLALEQLPQSYGPERRRMRVCKLRGLRFRGGYHDYKIDTGGIDVFPRLIASEHVAELKNAPLSSGNENLDRLTGGGLDPGTSTLIIGPAGTGKSSLLVHYLLAAAKAGKKPIMFCFDEGRGTLLLRAKGLGIDLEAEEKAGRLSIRQIDPAEITPDELAQTIRVAVETQGCGFIAIDSLNGYLNAMPEERFLVLQLHELLSYLAHKGVITVMVLAQMGMLGHMTNPIDLSYVADSVLLLRFFEAGGRMRKAISMIKRRSGPHEDSIRELSLSKEGLVVGAALTGFHGILTGTPSFQGEGLKLNERPRP